MNIDISKFWNDFLNDCEPVAHNLKLWFEYRWVRFHALPDSKRYPENENEYEEIIERHRAILNYLGATEMYILLPEYSELSKPKELDKDQSKLFDDAIYWRTIDFSEEHGGNSFWHLYISTINLASQKLDKVFRLVADDQLGNIMLVSPKNEFVFHPYDGGCDVILIDGPTRDALKNNFKKWLSKHEKGY